MANNVSLRITKRLRQIRNAWHSQFKLSFVSKVQWFRLGGCVAHYLTRRYTLGWKMELATIKNDFWELRDGEKCNEENPETFWIPSLDARKALKRGDAARVILEIECEDEDGSLIISGERGYVIVSEVIGEQYLGILDFQPATIEKGNDDFYLCFGAEVPFEPQHIINITRPPEAYIEWQLGQEPERTWYRK